MPVGIRELLMRLDLDAKGVERGVATAKNKFTELNQALELVSKGFRVAEQMADTLIQAIDRGQQVNELSNAFKNLYGQTTSLETLRRSTQGLVSDLDLLRVANQSAQAGLKPELFLTVAQAADTMGDSVGKSTVTALEELSFALATGQEKLLKQYVGTIDNAEANLKFAESLGYSGSAAEKYAKNLSETGKLEAVRLEAVTRLIQKTKESTGADEKAGDALQRLSATYDNAKTKIATAVNENENLRIALANLNRTIERTDFTPIISGVSTVVDVMTFGITVVERWSAAIGALPQNLSRIGDLAELKLLQNELNKLDVQLNQSWLFRPFNQDDSAIKARMEEIKWKMLEIVGAQTALSKAQQLGTGILGAFTGKLKESGETVTSTEELLKAIIQRLKEQREGFQKTGDAADDAASKLQEFNDQLEQQALQLQGTRLSDLFERALSSKDFQLAGDVIPELEQHVYNSVIQGYEAALRDNPEVKAAATDQALYAAEQYRLKLSDASKEAWEEQRKAAEAAFQDSVDFFGTILGDLFDGGDLKDTIEDMFKEIAIGFGAQILAVLAQSAGFNISSFGGSLGGFGQLLGNLALGAFGLGGGGSGATGSLLAQGAGFLTGGGSTGAGAFAGGGGGFAGSALGAAGSSYLLDVYNSLQTTGIGPVASGDVYAASLGDYSGFASTLGTAASVVGAAYGTYQLYGSATDNVKNPVGDTVTGLAAGASVGTLIAPGIGTAIGAVIGAAVGAIIGQFGGTTDQDTIVRQAVKEALAENTPLGETLTFQGAKGPTSFAGIDYADLTPEQVANDPNLQAANYLTKPLATLVSGGDSKIKEDFSSIFTQATGDAQNFVEVLINVQGLMKGMGLTAEDLKNELANAFLDSTDSAATFSEEINTVNFLAQDSLQHLGQIPDALDLIGDAASTNRTQLKGIELVFKEMAKNGIDNASEIHAYLIEKFGPDVAALFDKLTAAGIDTWEEIANATPEQLAIIFGYVDEFEKQVSGKFLSAGQKAASSFGSGASKIKGELDEIERAADDTAAALLRLGSIDRNPNGANGPGNAAGVGEQPMNQRTS